MYETVKVDLGRAVGKMKPMHAVNNGPVFKFAADQRITNIDHFRDAGIPYARTHDASFYASYGGEHTVDITAIFPNFDADPYDPASYDFTLTDEYMQVMKFAGVEPFYRLGQKIEHWQKKYGTIPPKDFKKWAVICEHIIKHLNYGWADGHEMGIKYWEIWNEPDLDPDDSTHKRCWGGTKAQFFEFYHIAATHLKEKFPELKIGGPAISGKMAWAEDFLAQLKAPLDFFSWHRYANNTEKVALMMRQTRELLDKYGFTETESILHEWNYVKGWIGDDWVYTLRAEKGMKGAAFIASVMCDGQKAPLDMLMYYDARPCGMNGMFNTDMVCDVLKGYYPFKAFGQLYRLGTEVYSESEGDLHVCAARDGDKKAVMLARFSKETEAPVENKKVKVEICGGEGELMKVYRLDRSYDLELVREEIFCGEIFRTVLELEGDSMYLLELEKTEI